MKRLFNNLLHRGFLPLLAVFLCLIGSTSQAWAGAAYVKVSTTDAAEGLVYVKNATGTPKDTDYTNEMTSGKGSAGSGKDNDFYLWAKPARGYVFEKWRTLNNSDVEKTADPYHASYGEGMPVRWQDEAFDGVNDHVKAYAGTAQTYTGKAIAVFTTAPSYLVKYETPDVANYTVKYEYMTVNTSTNKFVSDGQTFTVEAQEKKSTLQPTGDISYASDKVTLTATANNFICWKEDGVSISTAKEFVYPITKAATISAEFKSCTVSSAEGDLAVVETDLSAAPFAKSIVVNITNIIGSWDESDFDISMVETTTPTNGAIILGSKSYTDGKLTINYTYNPTSFSGTEVKINVAPKFGEAKEFEVLASLVEVVGYEACIEETDGTRSFTGTVQEVVAEANNYDNKVVKLMQDVTIDAPISFTRSMTFDINGHAFTSTAATAFSVDAMGIDVQVMDGSFSQTGVIGVENNVNNIVSVVSFSQRAKLTLVGGTMSAKNTSTGANAAAYGINVTNGSVFYMTGGKLTVNANKNAVGVNIATGNDYATVNGGAFTVSANTNAYGLKSTGTANITTTSFNIETLAGANAYGVYVNGGVSTFDEVSVVAEAKTDNAMGAYVNAGRLNVSAGSFDVTANAANACGVHVEAGATAMVQSRNKMTVNAASNAEGVYNAGNAQLLNARVDAAATADQAIAVNMANTATNMYVEDGTYSAVAASNVYGVYLQGGEFAVDGATFKGVTLSGNAAYGAYLKSKATIENATLYGETQGAGDDAYGVKAETNKTIILNGCVITGKAVQSNGYAIHSNAQLTATNCELLGQASNGDNAMSLCAISGAHLLKNCNATVSSYNAGAWGVKYDDGTLTIDGGTYVVKAGQKSTLTPTDALLYGVQVAVGKTATISNATFNVEATNTTYSKNAYGVYVDGNIVSTNTSFNVKAGEKAYGVYATASSDAQLTKNTLTAEATNTTDAYGLFAAKTFNVDDCTVSAAANTKTAYAMDFAATAKGDVNSGRFSANAESVFGPITTNATVGKVVLKGGYFVTPANLQRYMDAGLSVFTLESSHAEYAKGYRYALSSSNPSPYVCKIGSTGYATLEAALQYAVDNASTSMTIVMTQPYTLPAGDYVLPSRASLIVPYSRDHTSVKTTADPHKDPEELQEHLRLTFASGVNLNVSGTIDVGAKQYTPNDDYVTSYVKSSYGHLHMEEGSNIVLNGGAKLYAWGYITGKGAIKALNSSEVHEMFQLTDMKKFGTLSNLSNFQTNKTFPVNQYYIQNIEVPTTYYYGAQLICAFQMYYAGIPIGSKYVGDTGVKLVGVSDGLFQVTSTAEDAWVRKSYDPTTDRQIWEISSSAKLGSISMSIASVASFDSKDYVLPITNNMTIHVVDGNVRLTQDTQLQPGSVLEIDKTATLEIPSNVTAYVVDSAQWGNFAGGVPAKLVQFSPSWTSGKSPRSTALKDQKDAVLKIHGTLDVAGKLRTTAGGANICSTTEDAGTINFLSAAPTDNVNLNFFNSSYTARPSSAAQLKNANGLYVSTNGIVKDHSMSYLNGVWTDTYINECFSVEGTTVYAKPSEYVALANTEEVDGKLKGVANSDHTYTAIGGKLLILQEADCQWWEVEATATDGVFECKKEGYEGFYSYNDGTNAWELVKRNVTFYSNEEGTNVLKVIVTNYMGVPDQSVIANNPTKATTDAATYRFNGWKSSVTGTEYHYTAKLEEAEDDMFYTPVFVPTPRNYTITFADALNGANVPIETAWGEHPNYEAQKAATAQYTYTFTGWKATNGTIYGVGEALPAVGDNSVKATTYTAQWEQTLNTYTITWMDGEQILSTQVAQPYGKATSYTGVLPSKEADDKFAYAFNSWKNAETGATYANGSTPAVSGNTTYEAVYGTTPRYMITFANFDGTVLQKEAVTQNEVPAYTGVPQREPDRDGFFRFNGWKDSEGNVFALGNALAPASQKETYTAQYDYVTTVFEVTFRNYDGNGAEQTSRIGEGETPWFAGEIARTHATPAAKYWEFIGWMDENSFVYAVDAALPVASATSAKDFTAQWEEKAKVYTITFVYDAYGNKVTREYAYGAPINYDGPTPKQDDTEAYSYEFTGWSPTLATVTGDATYIAQFSQTEKTYEIRFVLGNGEDDVVYNLPLGAAVTAPTPTKDSDPADAAGAYTYTFNGWNNKVVPVASEATYTAQWIKTANKFNVKFLNYDGTELKSEDVAYGSKPTAPATPTKPMDEETVTMYTFTNWAYSEGGNVTTMQTMPAKNVTYTANFSSAVAVATVTTAGGVVTGYTSFTNALTAAKASAGSTLKLYANATTTTNGTTQTINSSMTIDFNGYTLSGSNTGNSGSVTVLTIAGGTVIFNDATGNGGISATNSGRTATATAIVVNTGANLTINGGTYYAYNSSTDTNSSRAKNAYAITNNGSLTINNGSFEAKGNTSTGSTILTINNAQTVTINGGKFAQTGKAATGGNLKNTGSMATLKGGYYTQNLTSANAIMATGYECVSSSEVSGYGYKVQLKKYDIIFKNGDDELQNTKVEHGSMPEYVGEKPQKAEDDNYTYEFKEWTPAIEAVTADATYTATFTSIKKTIEEDNITADGSHEDEEERSKEILADVTASDVEVVNNGTITILNGGTLTVTDTATVVDGTIVVEENSEISAETIIIKDGGNVKVDEGATVNADMLIIEASASASGQLTPENGQSIEALNAALQDAPVYFDFYFHAKRRTWYAFAVPFMVDPLTGTDAGTYGRDFDIIEYHGNVRAQGNNGWAYINEHSPLKPGKFYMILFDKDREKVRFTKKGGANTITTVTDPLFIGGEGPDANWNGIANPSTFHSTISITVDPEADEPEGQIYDSNNDSYENKPLSEINLTVGCPIFVQANEEETIVVAPKEPSAAAPARVIDGRRSGRFDLYLAPEGADRYTDHLTVKASEDATGEYTIVADLAKAGVSSKVAQMWTNAYGTRLCKQTAQLIGNNATYSLGLYAPVAGDYNLYVGDMPQDGSQLYLTYNNRPIWNLSMSEYILDLPQGTTNSYGLMLVGPSHVTTDVENIGGSENGVQKVIIDNQMYLILDNGQMFDATGKIVK